MNEKHNCLIWFDLGPYSYLHLGIARSINEIKKMNFYGLVSSKHEYDFLNQQKFTFKELVYYPECYIDQQTYDLAYLKKIEKDYDIDLWLLIYSERFFSKYRNNFHQFSKDEILSIVFHTIQFYIKYLEKIKPKFLIMQTAGENISNFLLYKIAKKIGIKIFMVNPIHIHEKFVLSDNLICREISDEYQKIIPTYQNSESLYDKNFIKNQSLIETVKVQSDFIFDNSTNTQKFKHYISRMKNDPEPIYQNYGKSKSKMLKAKYEFPTMHKKREEFLFLHSIDRIEDENFLYLPLQTEPESKVLATAHFFNDQINLVENVARSIPIEQTLYVKEHPVQKSKFWRPIDDYKRILELQNVKLVHPELSSQELISKCNAVIAIMGSAGFEALFYKKPVILFSDEYYDVLSMVKKVQNMTQLPEIIKNHLENFKFNNLEFNAMMEATNSCSLSIPYFSMMKDALVISSTQKNSEIDTSIEIFEKFYSTYEKYFKLIAKFFDVKVT